MRGDNIDPNRQQQPARDELLGLIIPVAICCGVAFLGWLTGAWEPTSTESRNGTRPDRAVQPVQPVNDDQAALGHHRHKSMHAAAYSAHLPETKAIRDSSQPNVTLHASCTGAVDLTKRCCDV